MKTLRFIMAMLLMGMTISMTAQTAAELKLKASKDAKKEAKRLKKEGWLVAPGGLPMERQLDRSYLLEYEFDSELQPKYVFGDAQSTGQFYDAAKLQASEVAKSNLVGKISTDITRLVELQIKNKQVTQTEANSAMGISEKTKSLVQQKLGALTPVLELYRTLKNGNVEVMIRVAYDKGKIMDSAKDTVDELVQ